jgi:hypothetical protein
MNAHAIDPGFFMQKHVNDVIVMKDIWAARGYVAAVIDAYVEAHPKVNPDNVRKARALLTKARNPVELATSIQNFILKHPSEGLGVLK